MPSFNYLIEKFHVYPSNILAITFTNKVAREMKERTENLLPDVNLFGLQISTFHSFCAKFLRKEIDVLQINPSFVIFDEEDQLRLLKLIGENNYLEATNLLKEKGTVYLPFMYLLPIFPDDALCMVAGMIKLKFPLHLIYICLCRGIGIATIVFGFSVIPFSEFDGVYDYLVLIAVILVYVFVLFKITRWLDKMYSKYLKRKQEKELTKQNDDSNEIKEIESPENKE